MIRQIRKAYIAIAILIIGLCPVPSMAGEIVIAAAADLNFAFKEITTAFEKKTGDHITLSLGSSGNFFAQIVNGAPFDLFFAADTDYPKKLEEIGLAEAGTLYPYAIGRIVLWAPKSSPVDVKKLGMESLKAPSVKKIAIANPAHAPYGRAAVAAMEYFKIYDRVKRKLVLGENISQTAQFIESGTADIGFIAVSLALGPVMKEEGAYWEVPSVAYPSLEQGAILLKGGKNLEGARVFLAFMKGQEGQAILSKYGFSVPPTRK